MTKLTPPRGFILLFLPFVLIPLVACHNISPTGTRAQAIAIPLMHVCEPSDGAWDRPLPQPQIPPPPTDKGLTHPERLRKAPLLAFKGEKELAAEAAKPNGWVQGKGTAQEPYVIRDLDIRNVTDTAGLRIAGVTSPLIIENVLVDGQPLNQFTPAAAFGIALDDCVGTVIRHCQVSRCYGIFAGGAGIKDIRIEDCYVFSCRRSIFTSGGSHCTATGNYVRDATEYGVFLYNGTDHTIENCYVMWVGKEGIGTNGNGHRAVYRNNVILQNGWTAINVEGNVDDVVVENNRVVESHYGIILMGNRTICRKNQVFYSSQMGISVYSNKDIGNAGIQVTDNLVVGSAQAGIDVMPYSSDVQIKANRVWQSDMGIHVAGPGALVEGNDVYRFFNGIQMNGPGGTVKDNAVYRGRNAIWLEGIAEPGSAVTGNRLHHLCAGIVVKGVKGGVLADNRLEAVGQPFPVNDCAALTIRHNDVVQIGYGGMTLTECTGCTLENNRLTNGIITAIQLNGGGKHVVKANTVADIKGEYGGGGIVLSGTKDNRVEGNTLERCGVAILFTGTANQGNVLLGNRYLADLQSLATPAAAEKLPEIEKNNALDDTLQTRK